MIKRKKPTKPSYKMLTSAEGKRRLGAKYSLDRPLLEEEQFKEIKQYTGLSSIELQECSVILKKYLDSKDSADNSLLPSELRAQLQETYNRTDEFLEYLNKGLNHETIALIDETVCKLSHELTGLADIVTYIAKLEEVIDIAIEDAPQPELGRNKTSPERSLVGLCAEHLVESGVENDIANIDCSEHAPLPNLVRILLEVAGKEPKPYHRSAKRFLDQINE